jgi:hypothetical protein
MTELKERIMGEVACSKRGEAKAVVAKVRAAGFEARISPWRNSHAEYPNDRMVLVWQDMNIVEDADKARSLKEFWNAVAASASITSSITSAVSATPAVFISSPRWRTLLTSPIGALGAPHPAVITKEEMLRDARSPVLVSVTYRWGG